MPTVHAHEPGLRLPVLFGNVTTSRAGLAGVVRRHGNENSAVPVELVFQLTAKLEPALVEDGFVQPRLGCYVFTRCLGSAFARLAHVAYLQILNSDHSVVFADLCCGFVQEVFAGVSDAGVNFLNFPSGFVPVFAVFDLATHLPLVAAQPGLMLLEAAKRRNEAAVAQGGEPNNTHVDSNGASGCWHRLFYFALSLDTGEPLAARLADSDVLGRAKNVPAVAIPDPAQLWKLNAAVGLIDFKALRKTETVAYPALFRPVRFKITFFA